MSGIFRQLSRLLEVGDEVSISIRKATHGKIRVIVLTKLPSEKSTDPTIQKIRAGLSAPVFVESSIEELDGKFVALLEEIASSRISLNCSFDACKEKNDEVIASANVAVKNEKTVDTKQAKPTSEAMTPSTQDAPEKPKGNSLI